MGFNSAFKGLKLLKNPGNGRLNNLNDPALNVLRLETNTCLDMSKHKMAKKHNPLKPKRRPLYLKTQSVPRSKHFSSRL